MMKNVALFLVVLFVALSALAVAPTKYDTVANDPTKTRIYTLDNGLKVYLSVNKETPRIQTYIAVRVGGKNDPAQTTGLAHYFEHLMFKGTKQFATQDYAAEKVLLDKIEACFEHYRTLTDSIERVVAYREIDSLSQLASKYIIANEYDKLMAAIGAEGTNAWTSFDETNYTENIPANQIENWAKIQVDRFANNVIRGFHTELETVYEEKNMSLTNDDRKVFEAVAEGLFDNHPYGKQTVLGTQEHLKNPSITAIKDYYKKWYVPNNMAVCMAGDLDPDQAMVIIDKHFGQLVPNTKLVKPQFEPENPITAPVEREVWGNDAENVTLAFRFGGNRTSDPKMLSLLDGLLNNGTAGLIDLNVNQKQLVLRANSGANCMSDYSGFSLSGTPKEGQTLDEVRDILLSQIELVKKGEFDELLLKAVIDNYRYYEIENIQHNGSRTYSMMRSFIDEVTWADKVAELDNMNKITKKDVVDFVNKNFDDNYVIVRKRQGKDPNQKSIDKPQITPISTNRDVKSDFLKSIENSKVTPIEPVFVDFDKDMSKSKTKTGVAVLYKKNEIAPTFFLNYYFEMGSTSDKKIGLAAQYLSFLGTNKYSVEQIKRMFYDMACSYRVNVGSESISISVSGLAENQRKAVALMEEILAEVKADSASLANLKARMLKQRIDNKASQRYCSAALQQYAIWGPKSPFTNVLTTEELVAVTDKELVEIIKGLIAYQHTILYYGPQPIEALVADLSKLHRVPSKLKPVIKNRDFVARKSTENVVYVAPYDAAQIYYLQVNNRGEKFNKEIETVKDLYNNYFGGGMSGIVFQEMREARGLAYSAWATVSSPSDLERDYVALAFIATQNDKMIQAIETFADIINNMPESEAAFQIAREAMISSLRTQRLTESAILSYYLMLKKLNLDYDVRRDSFDQLQNLTLADVVKYQQQYIKNNKWTYTVLGREADLDMESLAKYGRIERLTLEQIFGY